MSGLRMMLMSSNRGGGASKGYTDFYIGYAFYGGEEGDFYTNPLLRINSDDLSGMYESGFFSNLNNDASNMEVLNYYGDSMPFDIIQFAKSDGYIKMFVAPSIISSDLNDIVLRVHDDQTPIENDPSLVWSSFSFVVIPNHMDGEPSKNRAYSSDYDSSDKEYFTVVDDSNHSQTKYTTSNMSATTGVRLEMRGDLGGANNVALVSARNESSGERVSLTALSDGRIGLYNNGDGYLYPSTEPEGSNINDYIFVSGTLEYRVNTPDIDDGQYRSITVTNTDEYSSGFNETTQSLFETVMDGVIINVPYSSNMDYMAVGDFYSSTTEESIKVSHGMAVGGGEVPFTGENANQDPNSGGIF